MVTWAAKLGVRGRGSLEAADGNDLILLNSDGEGAGSAVQNSLGDIVERLESWIARSILLLQS
jgi:hypothetical protein